jgi:hypothetical protein
MFHVNRAVAGVTARAASTGSLVALPDLNANRLAVEPLAILGVVE